MAVSAYVLLEILIIIYVDVKRAVEYAEAFS